MRYKTLMILIVLVAFASALPAQTKSQDLTLDKIVEMTKAGLSPETIINTIINSETSLTLTVDQVMYLKEQGVHEDVINFILRTRPLPEDAAEETVVSEGQVPAEDTTASEELPQYVAGAAEGNYYDGYEYTDGYNYEDERYTPIIYHYYGPWFRAYPYYYGFYYYPSSYYYYCYWPDDFYYYYYYPRFVSWRYYYYYPSWYYYYPQNHHYYYYSGGRYTRAPHGRYIYRSGDRNRVRYAVPRTQVSGSTATRSRTVTSTRVYSNVIRSRRDGTGVTRTRAPNNRSTTSIRTRGGVTSRSKSSTIRSRIYGKRPQPTVTKPRTRSATPRSYSRPRTSGHTPKISRPSSKSRSRSYSSPSSSSRSRSKSYSTPKRSRSRPSTSSRSRSSSSGRSAVSRSKSSSSGKKKH